MRGGRIQETELHQEGRSFSRKFFLASELRQNLRPFASDPVFRAKS
jgi:hypothetical protein